MIIQLMEWEGVRSATNVLLSPSIYPKFEHHDIQFSLFLKLI